MKKTNKNKKSYLTLIGIIICIVAVVALYLPVLKYDILNWDDPKYILENPFIKTLSLSNLKHYFTEIYFLMYLPLTMLTYNIDYFFSEFSGTSYHVTSLLLHVFNTVFVFYLFNILFKRIKINHTFEFSLFVALMFGLHAVHIESVAWLAERKDVLYTFFYLPSIIFYLKFTENNNTKHYIMSVVLFLFSLVSKAQAMTLFLILIGLDYILNRNLTNKKVIVEKIPYIALSIIFGLVAIIGTRSEGIDKVDQYTLIERIIYASYAYTMYVAKIILPLNLSAIYPFPDKIYGELPNFFYLYPAGIIGVMALFFITLKNSKLTAFGIWFFTVSIIIVLQIFSYHNVLMADRYTYVSALGIFFIMVVGLDLLIKKYPKLKSLFIIIAFFYVGIQALFAKERLPVWKNSITLWSSVIEKYDNVATAYYNRGVAYADIKEFDKSISDFANVIRLDSTLAGAYFSIGNSFSEKNQLDKAIESFNKAIKIDTSDARFYSNRGIAFAKIGKVNEAINDFNKVLVTDPDNAAAFSNRGNSKFLIKDINGAITDYSQAIKLQSDYIDPVFNRGSAYLQIDSIEKAITDFDQTLQIAPNHERALVYRGNCYEKLNKTDLAIADYSRVIKINKTNIEAWFCRAGAWTKKNDHEKAFQDYSTTINLLPNHPAPYYQRGLAAIKLNKKDVACADFQKSYQLGNGAALIEMNKYCK